MWKTILRRLLIIIPEIIALSILVFLLAKAMPGDPFTGSINPHASLAHIHHLMRINGLYDPWYQQYWNWVVHLFHGNLGMSYEYQEPVTRIVGERAINTLWLAVFATVMTYAIGLPVGLYAGRHQNSRSDHAIRIYTYVTLSVPFFVVLVLGLWIFGYMLGWFPTTGSINTNAAPGMGSVISRIQHIVLPGLLQAFFSLTGIVQYLRSEVIDATHSDYVRTARSKGVPVRDVFRHHIFRNSLLPITATAGYAITGLLGGSVFTETIFSYPGMGLLFVSAINYRDYTVITALVLLFGFLNMLGTLLSDIIMAAVDPRIRIE
ncbi:ABC transporter permease [Furfurilactobacillus rossiae]|uniref:Oligopeptide ABC superfamily ATP binding cassette transporter, membrane protein n=1 Tax=Furfurilactobacillus rossiae DSM 15814 TaxID=1114972 RepID=A0A0R1REW6_9LACO|nr:ABC transporter permease [Furfurilactobacillus rossiae]KRL52741.1 oligopeptide ABC superfamily ATP binding cassette transporter, membrane protein [Furfurilactobacillus rossiae DSM 15814]QFR66675.1 ABC transporter permease subunit [Furfurilactobacillus rossiae]QLE62150.1 Oligopeptide transport system permease protein OppB [Furfurilactobacillus rossiae]